MMKWISHFGSVTSTGLPPESTYSSHYELDPKILRSIQDEISLEATKHYHQQKDEQEPPGDYIVAQQVRC